MRFVIQRVNSAKVEVCGRITGEISRGFLVLIGISKDDDENVADKMIRKLVNMRIFDDSDGKTNLSLEAVGGSLLLVSQFTLYADCKRGNRPSFTESAGAEKAEALSEYIIGECRKQVPVVETGVFGAMMDVSLVNDGPFTVILDSEKL